MDLHAGIDGQEIARLLLFNEPETPNKALVKFSCGKNCNGFETQFQVKIQPSDLF